MRKLDGLLPYEPVVQKRPLRWAYRIYWLLRHLPALRKDVFALGLTSLIGMIKIPKCATSYWQDNTAFRGR